MLSFLTPPQGDGATPVTLRPLQGEWQLVGTADAKRPDVGDPNIRLVIDGNRVTMTFFGKVTNQGTVTVGPGKRVDMQLDNGAPVQGVYELNGDVLTMCFADAAKSRPTSLVPAGAQWVETWKKAK